MKKFVKRVWTVLLICLVSLSAFAGNAFGAETSMSSISPNTGDSANIVQWVLLFITVLIGFIVIRVIEKRK